MTKKSKYDPNAALLESEAVTAEDVFSFVRKAQAEVAKKNGTFFEIFDCVSSRSIIFRTFAIEYGVRVGTSLRLRIGPFFRNGGNREVSPFLVSTGIRQHFASLVNDGLCIEKAQFTGCGCSEHPKVQPQIQ